MSEPVPGRPSRRLLIVGGVVAVALVAIVAYAIGAAGPGSKLAAAPTSAATSTASDVAPAGTGSACGLPGDDPAGTELSTAPNASWTTVGTMAAPSASRIGPGRIAAAGLRSCYAHTVAGALFAMANIWAMGTDPRLAQLLLEEQTVTGPGRDAALKASVPPANTGLRAQIAGFKVTSYTGEAATVDLAFQLSNGDLVSVPGPVVWQDGDWKLQPADDGQSVFGAAALTSLADYVPWTAAQ